MTSWGSSFPKKVGSTDLSGNTPFQKVDYAYNIRGWLKGINNTDALFNAGGDPGDLFAFRINYDRVENTTGYEVKPLYNGNIAETFWRTASDNYLRSYDHAYDAMNRLTRSFYQKEGAATHSYNEDIQYDRNGNIKGLQRNGASDGSVAQGIDILTYTYDPQKPNMLRKVMDASLSPQGFRDDSDGITDPVDDYAYDDFGNMTADQNKGITQITYNHLNLPTKILFGGEAWKIEYLYAADGRKVRKTAPYLDNGIDGGIGARTMDYLGGFHYQDGILRFFPTAEGYVDVTKNKVGYSYSYVFNYTDHLGNIRLSYAENPQLPGTLKVLEENHYYPFGLKHTNYNSDVLAFREKDPAPGLVLMAPAASLVPQFPYNYKYNGKEFQDEMGMNWYDYGARNYDPAIGRWNVVDGKAELYFGRSPYIYALNTPVQAIDPDGNLVIFINGMHYQGDGGKPDYWRRTEEKEYLTAFGPMSTKVYVNFDQAVMNRLGDYKAIYRDGSMGGITNLATGGGSIFGGFGIIFGSSNATSTNRINGGYSQGTKDAKQIIASLSRDKEGNIVESIKIISHSMGAAYAKGYVKAILEYAKKNNIKGLIIAFEADFAPYQPNRQSAVKAKNMGDTLQFSHSEDSVAGDDPMPGAKNQDTSDDKEQSHSIFSFLNQILNLPTGKYIVNGIPITIQ